MPPLLAQTHTAPTALTATERPAERRVGTADKDRDQPWKANPTAPDPTSLGPCWVQTPALRVQTHTAPVLLLSASPPTSAVLPSADKDTDTPWFARPTASDPTSFGPCCVQTPPLLVQTHTAPTALKEIELRNTMSSAPPTRAVLPSAEIDTDMPWNAFPTAPEPTNFGPCWVNWARAGRDNNSMATTIPITTV